MGRQNPTATSHADLLERPMDALTLGYSNLHLASSNIILSGVGVGQGLAQVMLR